MHRGGIEVKMLTFALRTYKEIVRDPLTIVFGLGFPLVLLLMLSLIQANIPADLFVLDSLTPGICVFGLSFISLFSAILISKDTSTSLQRRLFTTPLKASDFLLGYTLPLLPLSLVQSAVCYAAAIVLGMEIKIEILWSLLFILPISLLYIATGLLCGSVLNDKQVGGVCGALLTNLTAWLSGIWFDVDLVGGVFGKIARALPFLHAVELQRAVLAGHFSDIKPHFAWVLGYTIVIAATGAGVFMRKMKEN